ncbi:MAG: hypothetical protein IJL76_02125 [Bacilli bacterium]|nr:hypothetical protein [Bacilli bacterium]
MKIIDYNFREIDREIIKIEDKTILDKLNLELNIPFYGIIYIDHKNGISLRIIGDDNTTLLDKVNILRYDDIKNIEINSYDYKDKELVNKLIDSYYVDSDINKVRDIKELDKYRLKSNPDTLLVSIEKDNDTEEIWSLVMGYSNDGIICGLLSDSKLYDNLLRGSTIVVKEDENLDRLIMIGRIDL